MLGKRGPKGTSFGKENPSRMNPGASEHVSGSAWKVRDVDVYGFWILHQDHFLGAGRVLGHDNRLVSFAADGESNFVASHFVPFF